MKKTSQPSNDVASMSGHWSIATGRLTAKGEAELLRLFGSTLQEGYGQIIEEPMPDHIQSLMARFIEPTSEKAYEASRRTTDA